MILINCKIILIPILFFSLVFSQTVLAQQPKSFEESAYRKYFDAVAFAKNSEPYWDLYQDLAKKKKLVKLRHASVKRIIDMDLESITNTTLKYKNFSVIARQMLKNLQAQPEGVAYELSYLRWILKNKNVRELCHTERSRWLSQASLSLSEVTSGLESCPVTLDDFIYRVRMLIFSGEQDRARIEIGEFAERQKLAAWEKAYLQGVYFSNSGDPASAFQTVIPFERELSESKDYFDNLFYIAQRAGELAKAEEIISRVIAKELSAGRKKEWLFQKGFLYYQTRRYKEALVLFTNLIQTHSSHKRKIKSKEYDDLTWLKAWCHYLDKNYEKARETLMENQKWARDKARNIYWLAQAEWARDHRMVALAHFRQLSLPVSEGKFFSYYNYMGWLRFESYKKFSNSELLREYIGSLKPGRDYYSLPDISTDPLKLIAEYRSYFEDLGSTDEGTVQLKNQEDMASDPNEFNGFTISTSKELKTEMAWADTLILWGHRDLAKWHLYEVEKNLTNKAAAEPLIQYYLDSEYYNRALTLANNVIPPAGRRLKLSGEDNWLWKSIYPKAYEPVVTREANKSQVPQNLIWAIMKAETQYKADAISPVGAVGLMQFMPYTSQKVAVLVDMDYKAADLFEPSIAVRFGAAYLKKLSNELDDQLPLIAAAYNGGPHRVKMWLRNLKQDDGSNLEYDAFIEHIPFNETRTYVKRVLTYILSYQKLYEDKMDFHSSKWLIEKSPYKFSPTVSFKEEWPLSKK